MERVKSKLVDDVYIVNSYGIQFESGIEFSFNEMKIIKEQPQEVIKTIYYIKKYFGGEVIQ